MPKPLGNLRPYVVQVLNQLDQVEGTGFVCHPEGYVLTCWHVLESWKAVGKTQGEVLFNGNKVAAEWISEYSVEGADLAVLKLSKSPGGGSASWQYLPLDVDWRVQVHDQLTSFGYPAGPFATTGIPTSFNLQGLTPTQVDGVEVFPLFGLNLDDIDRGYSGAPVVNETTQKVIGLIHAKHHDTQAFIVPLRTLFDAWRELRTIHEKSQIKATTTTGDFRSGKLHKITIGKISLFGLIEIGPFEFPWPQRLGTKKVLGALAVLLGIAGAGIYWFTVQSPLSEARDALRIARYDTALDKLSVIPTWLARWPAINAMRKKAELGAGFQKEKPDWEVLGKELEKQRKTAPEDADLMVLEAAKLLRQEKYEEVAPLLKAALEVDEKNAEAWYLFGLDRFLFGDLDNTVEYYRKAVTAAPDSPRYRNNLAHTLLQLGKVDESIEIYRKISQFPLARVGEAHGHWTKGEMRKAADLQTDAVKILDDATLQGSYYNRLEWRFTLPTKGVRLSSLADKRCYALLGKVASLRLGGNTAIIFPPEECNDLPLEICELLADDLCRFVDLYQPDLRTTAGNLRQILGQPEGCPMATATDGVPSE